MIRTTLSCCALFGSLLVATHVVHRQSSDGLRPVDELPSLQPVEPASEVDAKMADRSTGVVRTSTMAALEPSAGQVALALNTPHSASADDKSGVSAVEGDALFDLVLEETPNLVSAEDAAPHRTPRLAQAKPLTQRHNLLRFADGDAELSVRATPKAATVRSADASKTPRNATPVSETSKTADATVEDSLAADSLAADSLAGEPIAETATPQPRLEPDDLIRPDLSDEMVALRDEIRTVLQYYADQAEDVSTRSPWGIMHALIAYGVDTEVIANGRRVNAIGWLCWNGTCRGQRLFSASGGELRTQNGPGVQGHEGQFLAMLAQSRVPSDFEMQVDGRRFTVEDLIAFEQRTCQANSELTFKLIGLSHYLDSDTEWTNERGEKWNIPRLIQEELKQPVVGAACGGTHRMMGFSYAVRKREQRGEPIEGQWLRAKKYVDAYHTYTFKLQNRDGSFSTDWFRGRGDLPDPARRVQTTGHILEWLVYSLPEDQLTDPRVVRAVAYLTRLMNRQRTWEIGPKGHALHALVLYDERVFGRSAEPNLDVARIDEPETSMSEDQEIRRADDNGRSTGDRQTSNTDSSRSRFFWKLGR